jgi:predicted permease
MAMLNRLKLRLRALFFKSRLEEELDAEVRFHLEREIEENLARGMTSEEARYAAIRSFGGVERVKEESRDVRGIRLLEEIWQHLRYGARMLMKKPGFTLIVVITLALGIGANTAVFSLIDGFLLRSLPVKDPQRLVFLHATTPRGGITGSFPYPIFEHFRDQNRSFSGIFAFDNTRVSVTVEGQPEMVWGDFVSGSYFDVLGVSAILGRTFTADDDQAGKQPVAVIGYRYWERRFGRDPAVIGKTIYLANIPFAVIGVTSSGFSGLNVAGGSADVVLPMFMQPQLALGDHNTFGIMGRLKPDASPEQARADLDVIYQQALTQAAGFLISPQAQQEIRARKIQLKSGIRGDSTPDFASALPILLAVVGIVLLIACLNVANLTLARAVGRRREIAVRLSLGAGRGRLIRQLLTESILLSMLGGFLGLLVAQWLVSGLLAVFSNGNDPIPFDLKPDVRILAFTGAVSLLTGILFGLAPAMAATKVDLIPMLKDAEGESRPLRRRLTKSLVVAQVALSLALLIGAGLLIRSLQQLYQVDTGYEREKLLGFGVYPATIGYDRAKEMRFYSEAIERMNAIPGVQSTSLTRRAIGFSKGVNPVGPRFFETAGIGLLQGREFSTADTETAPKVVIISESVAQRFLPNVNPLGQPIPGELARFAGLGGDVQIVGVVRDTRHLWSQAGDLAIYIPYTQASPQELGQMGFVVRTAGNPMSVVPAVRQQIQTLERDLPLVDIGTVAEGIKRQAGEERSMAMLLGFFGALALILSSIGLYGTMSYAVSRRTKELGIRLALGAQRNDVLRMILREALQQVAIGVAVGIPVALAATRMIASMLFGVKTTDPVTISVAVLVMVTIAFVAGYLPTRGATKIDPLVALRCE